MPRQQKFTTTIKAGNYRKSLEALRDTLAEALEEVDGCHKAPLAKQLAEVLAKLDTMRVPEVSKLDDLAARRAARLDGEASDAPAKKVVGGTGGGRTGGQRGSGTRPVAAKRAGGGSRRKS